MQTVEVSLGARSYPVRIGSGLLRQQQAFAASRSHGKLLVVTDEVVAPLYLEALLETLGEPGIEVLIVPQGEAQKTVATWHEILDRLVRIRAGRDATVIGLGGGVIGDVSGFAAAAYMRGVAFVQVPTTLLAQVDSSVGGKTAVNHEQGKNLIGAFHQPSLVVADTATLATLDPRQFRAGLAEVVKYGALGDIEFFAWLEDHVGAVLAQEADSLAYLIRQCVSHKARIVARDELETGQRALLNLGHSFGHALERLGEYRRFLHGEAVSIGMVIAARLSEQRGLCPAGTARKIGGLLDTLGLPVAIPDDIDPGRLFEIMELDKKNMAGQRRLILLESIGHAVIDHHSTPDQVMTALQASMA